MFLLARGKGKAPAENTLAWLEQTGTDDVRTLVTQLREAMVSRTAHDAELRCFPIRHIEDPHARLVLATWLCIAEAVRNGMANSRTLWLGPDRAGMAGGIAGRLGVTRWTVGRMLDALEASGALKRWQAPDNTPGVMRGLEHGHSYHCYLVRVIPRDLARQVHSFYARRKARTSAPEPTTTEAPAQPTPDERAALERVGALPATPKAPPVRQAVRGPSVETGRTYAWETPQQAEEARAAARARFGAFLPSGPPGEA